MSRISEDFIVCQRKIEEDRGLRLYPLLTSSNLLNLLLSSFYQGSGKRFFEKLPMVYMLDCVKPNEFTTL